MTFYDFVMTFLDYFAWSEANMILFAIIGENLGVCGAATVTFATIIGMLIVCWAIYTVYTGGCSDL